jgi:ferredoxin hydrogenase large subunit
MEAALRSAYFLLSGEELKDPNIISVRGLNKALVEATIPIPVKANGGKIFELRVAVVNGALQELNHVMRIINEDKNRWHFIEVMNCPGGCVNGGGQPLQGAGSAWLRSSQPLPLRL